MKIFILRHGKAEEQSENQRDYDRALAPKGIKQIHKIGSFLQKNKVKIDKILSSTAKRTMETTEIVNTYLQCKNIATFEGLYLTDRLTILKYICESGEGDNLLLVGHNFGISEFVSEMINYPLTLSTGTLVEIDVEFIENWKMCSFGMGKLIHHIPPKTL